MQAAEENPVRVEHVDQPGEPQPEALCDQACRGPHRGVGRVLVPEQGAGLLEHGGAWTGYPAGRRHQAERVGLDVQAAAASAAARASARVDADVPGFHPEAGTAGIEDAVEHERSADALVAGGHHQQVRGVAARAVPVLGQRGEVDVVGRCRSGPGRAGQAGPSGLRGEDVPDPDAGRPADVQRADGDALGLGHGGRHRQAGPDAGPARRPQQPGAGPGGGGEHPLRVARHRQGPAVGRDDLAAEADQRDLKAVRVHLGGEGHGAVRVDREPVRGTAQGAAARRGVHPDQPQRLEFGRYRAGRGPGDAEARAQLSARGGAPAVDERQSRA